MAIAGDAGAQERTREVYITLAKELCDEVRPVLPGQIPRLVSVVTNERDITFDAKPLPAERCKWRFGLDENEKQNIDISLFSLRIEGLGRTPCRRAKRVGSKFQLIFDTRGGANTRDLQIESRSFDYTREVKALSNDDVQCWEEETSPRTLYNTQFDIEDIHLQLYEKNPVACGVILNKVASLGKAKKGVLVPIQSEELIRAVNWQELQGRNCYAPGITPPAAIAQSLVRKVPLEIKVK